MIRRSRVNTWLGLVLLGNVAVAGETGPIVGWRQNWHGDFPDATCVTDFSATRNVIWKTKTESWSNADPVIVGDRIFITEDPYTLACLSAKDGKVLWRHSENKLEDVFTGEELARYEAARQEMPEARKNVYVFQRAVWEAKSAWNKNKQDEELQAEFKKAQEKLLAVREEYRKDYGQFTITRTLPKDAGYSTPTAVSDGRNVYAYFGNDVVCSYDFDGKRRWAVRAGNGSEILHHACRNASPTIIDDKLIVHVDATHLYAFDLDTGEQLWDCPAENEFTSPVAMMLDDLPVILSPCKGEVIDARTGKMLHTVTGMYSRTSTLVANDGLLYQAGVDRGSTAQAYQLSHTNADGKDIIQSKILWTHKPLKRGGLGYYASPLIHDGLMYRLACKGALQVLEAETGESVYEQQLKFRKGYVYTSPTLIGDIVFVAGENGTVYLLKTGREFKQVAKVEFEPMRSCPVAIGERLYIRGLEHMYCIGKK